ncbi:MAG: hypothetical protein WD016_04905 [Balneolaceae bacterium]
MKNINAFILCSLFLTSFCFGQSKGVDYSKDVETIDGVIEALYASISGEKGEERDWNRFRNLVLPEARLIPTGRNSNGELRYTVYSPEEFIENTNSYFVENGFYEYEIHRDTQNYGHVVHLFSTYASKHSEHDAEPFNKGINSIQLFNDGERWWVVTIYWSHESKENPIPEEYQGTD